MKRVGLFFIVMIVGLMVVLIYNKSVVIEVTDELSDQIVLFAFMKDKRVVRYAEVPREFVEFELGSKI